jgi:meiotically up-regulated gene 157 (Mug157) protein
MKFSRSYYEASQDAAFFLETNSNWLQAMKRIVEIIKIQQNGTEEQFGHEDYLFRRLTDTQTETLMLGGRGSPAKKCGE